MNNNLKIQVFGSGCPSCKRLYDQAVQIVNELELDAEVEYVTDVQRLMALGVMQSPVLAVNDQLVAVGYVPDKEEIKKAIMVSLLGPSDTITGSGCGCGGNC